MIEQRSIFVALEGLTLEAQSFGESFMAIGAAAIAMERELGYIDAII